MSYLKRLTNAALGRLQAFRMYGGIGMSASSLHRESTDSLIQYYSYAILETSVRTRCSTGKLDGEWTKIFLDGPIFRSRRWIFSVKILVLGPLFSGTNTSILEVLK